VARTQPPDVRREQLLDAAEQLLLEQGLRATTVADVAEVAGLAKGTMYLYFGSKDELLAGLRARYVGRYLAPLARAHGDVRTRVHGLVTGLVDVAADNWQLHHVLFHQAGFSEADVFSELRHRFAVLLRSGVADGQLSLEDPDLAASFLLHGVHGTLVEYVHARRRRGRGRTARALAELADRALGPAP
jgi:TetR/AcrR family transcriptional regulator, transcriptional repressor for nem operon